MRNRSSLLAGAALKFARRSHNTQHARTKETRGCKSAEPETQCSSAAAEMAESIASGHRQGIRLEAFPQPRVLKGTVGVEVEEGPMFFHADELRAFWEAEDNGAESETESMLAADEEGLGHLRVKVWRQLCCHKHTQTFRHFHAGQMVEGWISRNA